MSYKCRICGLNDVEHMGDICELCAISQDPYAAAMQGNPQSVSRNYSSTGNGAGTSYAPPKGRSRKVTCKSAQQKGFARKEQVP